MIAIRDILVPTDFSAPAKAALDYARGLAQEFGSRVHLLHVIASPQMGWAVEGSTVSWPRFLAELQAEARAQFAKLLPPDDPLASITTQETVLGVPVEQILAYAVSQQIDLIVMGTHGRGLVGHMFLGSVAERVVRRAPVPVLTVHAAPAAAARSTAAATASHA